MPSGDFAGKVIAVTGGASGIGLAACKTLSSRGAIVCIADVNASALSDTEAFFKSQSAQFMISTVDISKSAEVDSWIDSIVEKHGRLDGAANCAGIAGQFPGMRSVAELKDLEWNRIISVNLTGLMYCLRAELRKVPDGASIVNVASVQGVMGFANNGAYVASKHGVIGLTRSAAKEFGIRNIRVNALAPGEIRTPLLTEVFRLKGEDMGTGTHEPSAIRRQGTPEEMGNIIAFLLGPESSFITGAVIGADGGLAC